LLLCQIKLERLSFKHFLPYSIHVNAVLYVCALLAKDKNAPAYFSFFAFNDDEKCFKRCSCEGQRIRTKGKAVTHVTILIISPTTINALNLFLPLCRRGGNKLECSSLASFIRTVQYLIAMLKATLVVPHTLDKLQTLLFLNIWLVWKSGRNKRSSLLRRDKDEGCRTMSPIVITEAKKIPFRMFYLSRTWLSQSRGLGPILLNLFRPYFTNAHNKLECLSLAGLFSPVECLRVRSGAFSRM